MKVTVHRKRQTGSSSPSGRAFALSRNAMLAQAKMLCQKLYVYKLDEVCVREQNIYYRLDHSDGVRATHGKFRPAEREISDRGLMRLVTKAQTKVDNIERQIKEEMRRNPELVARLGLEGKIKPNNYEAVLNELVLRKRAKLLVEFIGIKVPKNSKAIINIRVPGMYGGIRDAEITLTPDRSTDRYNGHLAIDSDTAIDKLHFLQRYDWISSQLIHARSKINDAD